MVFAFGHLGWDTALKASGLAILIIMTLRHTFRPGKASVHRVRGGVAAYLLIGLTWAFGYKLIMERRPDAIHFQSSTIGTPTGEPSRLIDFSFGTLTSVGCGPTYPIHRIARSFAMAEALMGQLYPPILMATNHSFRRPTTKASRKRRQGPNCRLPRNHHLVQPIWYLITHSSTGCKELSPGDAGPVDLKSTIAIFVCPGRFQLD